jgi:hypothetical protein
MVNRISSLLFAAAIAAGAVSCKKSSGPSAADREAKFRAEQKAKALKAYQDLVKKYPDSEYADKAKERIRALAPPTTPAKK